MEIPVYLFTGFLESGKTTFIQQTLCDPRFNDGTPTLVLCCEEGFECYDPSEFPSDSVTLVNISDEAEISPLKLTGHRRRSGAERVLIEYNGMWQLSTLLNNLPEEWVVYQNFLFFDASTFDYFNNHLRNLVVDKLGFCELVVFNRFGPSNDKMMLHKIVRATNKKTDIAYETADGVVTYDDIPDPLPYDINASNIRISDDDYAIWYRDMSDNLETYNKKTVTFKCKVAKKAVNKNSFVVGRPIMTCCEDDIKFAGLVCTFLESDKMQSDCWLELTARITVKNHKLYNRPGPVLEAVRFEYITPLENEVATFY